MLFENMDVIRSRAHQIWMVEGCPDGRALDHWLRAKREIARPNLEAPWYDHLTCGDEDLWMRQALWSPQPYQMLQ